MRDIERFWASIVPAGRIGRHDPEGGTNLPACVRGQLDPHIALQYQRRQTRSCRITVRLLRRRGVYPRQLQNSRIPTRELDAQGIAIDHFADAALQRLRSHRCNPGCQQQ